MSVHNVEYAGGEKAEAGQINGVASETTAFGAVSMSRGREVFGYAICTCLDQRFDLSGTLGKARDKLLLNRSAEGKHVSEHVRLRDSAEKNNSFNNCPDLGCEGTDFQCRWC